MNRHATFWTIWLDKSTHLSRPNRAPLARSLKEGVNVLADWCKRGVRVIAITQQIAAALGVKQRSVYNYLSRRADK